MSDPCRRAAERIGKEAYLRDAVKIGNTIRTMYDTPRAEKIIREETALRWTRDLPTQEGWYWHRCKDYEDIARCLESKDVNDPEAAAGYRRGSVVDVLKRHDGVWITDASVLMQDGEPSEWAELSRHDGDEWAGPISAPEQG